MRGSGGRRLAGILSICVNFTAFSFVMAYNNKKVSAIFGCHIILFVFITSTFNSPNPQYFEIFGFIRIDFMCFSDKGFLEINLVFNKKIVVFYYADNSYRRILLQILRYITHDSIDSTTMLIQKANFIVFSVFYVICF